MEHLQLVLKNGVRERFYCNLYFLGDSHDCDFEDFTSCSWKNSPSGDHEWKVHSGRTKSPKTGPMKAYGEYEPYESIKLPSLVFEISI